MHALFKCLGTISPALYLNLVLYYCYARLASVPGTTALVFGCFLCCCYVLGDVLLRLAFVRWGTRMGGRAPQVWASICLLRNVMLTPIYALSLVSMHCWQESLHWHTLLGSGRNFPGLVSALGPVVYLWVVLVCAVLCLFLWLHYHRVTVRYQRMLSEGPAGAPLASRIPELARMSVVIVSLDLALVADGASFLDSLPRDPVVCFYLGRNEEWSSEADVVADRMERTAYPSAVAKRRADVIIITVDCLRADHLPLYGYERNTTPFLNEFVRAEKMGRIDMALSVGNKTKFGVLGTFASRFVGNLRTDSFKLYEVLKKQGYATHLISSGDKTKFMQMENWYGKDLDLIHDGVKPGPFEMFDDRQVAAVLESLPDRGETPSFFYLHISSAHPMGMRLPEFERWSWRGNSDQRQKYCNQYDNGVLQADHTIGEIIAVLRRKGYMKDYLLFIDGDHGESIGEQEAYGHGYHLTVEQLRVPLFWKDSTLGQTPDYPFASLADIAPTVLSRLGLPIPKVWDGLPFEQVSQRTDTFVASSKLVGWAGLVRPGDGTLFYLTKVAGEGQFEEQAYRLAEDPRQTVNVIGSLSASEREGLRKKVCAQFQ